MAVKLSYSHQNSMEEELNQYLQQKYYDLEQPGSLGGVDALYRAVKEDKNRKVS